MKNPFLKLCAKNYFIKSGRNFLSYFFIEKINNLKKTFNYKCQFLLDKIWVKSLGDLCG